MSPPVPFRARVSTLVGGAVGLSAALIALWLVSRASPPPTFPGGGNTPPVLAAATAQPSSLARQAQPSAEPQAGADPLLIPQLRYQIEALLMEAGDAATPDELKHRLGPLVHKHFAAHLATRALAMAERYVDYRVALGALSAPKPDDPAALRASLNARQHLREKFFTPDEYDALFERETALDRYTLARLEIQHNAALTAEQKSRALKETEAELPADQRAERAQAVAHLDAAAQSQDFEARGVDERTRYQLRSATYGADAAQALARLDQEERAWNQKLENYASARAQATDPGQLQALRDQLFTPQEQMRVEAALALRQTQR